MDHMRDLMSNGSFEKRDRHWQSDSHQEHGYFTNGVHEIGDERIVGFADRFGFAYAAPSDGSRAFYVEWDGAPGQISLSQGVSLKGTVSDILSFDYEAGWDLQNYGAQADRTFIVRVTDHKTGEATDFTILTASAGDFVADTGLQHVSLDLSAYAGHGVTIDFIWDIPAGFDGPAVFMLDDVTLDATSKKHKPAEQLHADAALSDPSGHELVAGEIQLAAATADHFLV